MGVADRLVAGRARRRLARGAGDDELPTLHASLLRAVPDDVGAEALRAALSEARATVGAGLPVEAAEANERALRLRLADAAVARAIEDPDGVADAGLRELGGRVADLGVPDALNRDGPYEQLGLARSRLGRPPHALREVPRLRPVGAEAPLLCERAVLVRGPEHVGEPGEAVQVDVTTHRLGLAGAHRTAVPLVHLVGIDVQPVDGRPVLLEHANGSPLLLRTSVPQLLARTLREARLARVRAGDRAATTPFPTTNTGAALGGLPLGSSGFSFAAPGGGPASAGRASAGGGSAVGGSAVGGSGAGRHTRASATSPWGDEATWTPPTSAGDHHRAGDPDGLYALLGLEPGADPDEVKRAFRRAAQRTHPDATTSDNTDPADAEEAFKAVAEAFRVLSDPASRAAYDRV